MTRNWHAAFYTAQPTAQSVE